MISDCSAPSRVDDADCLGLIRTAVVLDLVVAGVVLLRAEHRTWFGPVAFVLAAGALALTTSLDAPQRPTRADAVPTLLGLGVAAALIGLTMPTQVLSGPVASQLSDSARFTAFETPDALALR